MNAPSTRILVVEDDALSARDLQRRLIVLGYEVIGIAATGEEALQLVSQTIPDIVLMDIMLAGSLDGIQTAEKMRKGNAVPIVIYLTANSGEALLQRAIVTGPFGFLTKPYDSHQLRAAIEVGLYNRGVERERATLHEERAALVTELQKALAEVKTLRGLIPICSWCGKIRDDQGFWQSVETFIQSSTIAKCTHGICPECRDKVIAEDASREIVDSSTLLQEPSAKVNRGEHPGRIRD